MTSSGVSCLDVGNRKVTYLQMLQRQEIGYVTAHPVIVNTIKTGWSPLKKIPKILGEVYIMVLKLLIFDIYQPMLIMSDYIC
jgi:hypothetical protein